MVITVPNAFSLRSLLHVLRGYEKVATDHVCYYSYANLRELASRNGFRVDRIHWYRYSHSGSWLDKLVDLATWPLLRIWPQLSEGLIAECSLVNRNNESLNPHNLKNVQESIDV